MLRTITLLTLISCVSDFVAATTDSELQELREVMQQFHEDYNQGNMSRLTSHFKVALGRYGDGHQSASSSYVQSFLSKLESDGELRAMQKLENEWNDYTESLGKHYDASENSFRMSLFESNELLTEQQNRLYEAGVITYTTGLNDFADLTEEEFNLMNGFREINESSVLGGRHKRQAPNKFYTYNPKDKLPRSVDWRKRGVVTPVRNQGECGSCYAFGALGALEAYHKIKNGKLLDLSVQNVIDCTWYLGSNGCRGGWMIPIFVHAKKYGIAAESKYPYVQYAHRVCKWRKELAVAKDEGFHAIKPGDELGLQHAVAKHGPVVVAIAGHRRGFRFYRSGVYNDPGCDKPTHAVLVVGYGTHKKYGDYWIAKNSWGTHWGRNGYIYMARNKGNMCFIASYASLPA